MGIMASRYQTALRDPLSFTDMYSMRTGRSGAGKRETHFHLTRESSWTTTDVFYLYSGFYTPVPAIATGFRKLKFEGGYVLELEPDMKTVRAPEKLLFPKEGEGSFCRA